MLVTPGLVNLAQVTVRFKCILYACNIAQEWYPSKIPLMFARLEPQFIFCGSSIESHGPFVGKEVKLITCYLSL